MLENLVIESLEERRAVSKEIIDNTLHYLHGVFGRDNPSKSMFLFVFQNIILFTGKKNAERVSYHLASVYPQLFKYDEKEAGGLAPATGGYGLGGVKGLKNLPSTICSRVFNCFWHFLS